jgi:hypothetical protein
MSPVTKSNLWRCLFGAIAFFFGGISTILGLNPSAKIVSYIFGEERIKDTWALFMFMEITPDTLRWYFVILGNLFWLLAGLIFVGIPISRANAARIKVQEKFDEYKKWNEDEHDKMKVTQNEINERINKAESNARALNSDIRKRERSVRKIHNKTYLMLEEIRKRKGKKCLRVNISALKKLVSWGK